MFHVSFLIKENRAGILICPDSGFPLIRPLAAKQSVGEEEANNQVVMNWTVEYWRKLVRHLRIETPMIE